MSTTRTSLSAVSYYCTMMTVGLPITTFFRIYVAEELATDKYLYHLLHLAGLFFGAVIGSGVATRQLRRRAPADGGACGN